MEPLLFSCKTSVKLLILSACFLIQNVWMKYLSQRNFGQKSEIVWAKCFAHKKVSCNNNEKTRSGVIKRLRNNAIKIQVDYKWGIPSPPVVFSTNLCFQAGFWTCESAYYFNASVSPLTMLKTMWWAAISLWYDFVSASCFWPDGTFLKEGSDKTYFLALSSPSRPPPHFHKLNYCWFTICISFTCTAQWFRVFCRLYSIIGYYKILGIISFSFFFEGCSVMSDSLWPHGLYIPWNSPGQNTWVGSLSLLQGIFPSQGSNPGLPHCRWILYQLSH